MRPRTITPWVCPKPPKKTKFMRKSHTKILRPCRHPRTTTNRWKVAVEFRHHGRCRKWQFLYRVMTLSDIYFLIIMDKIIELGSSGRPRPFPRAVFRSFWLWCPSVSGCPEYRKNLLVHHIFFHALVLGREFLDQLISGLENEHFSFIS